MPSADFQRWAARRAANRHTESKPKVEAVKTVISKFFRYQPSRETFVALIAGAVVVGLSAATPPFESLPWIGIAIRDIGQILLAGILFPLAYSRRSCVNPAEFGLSFKKWPVFLPINLVLGVLLLFLFLSESPPQAVFRLDAPAIWSAAYVMSALLFRAGFLLRFSKNPLRASFRYRAGDYPDRFFLHLPSHRFSAIIWKADFCRPAVRHGIPDWEQRFAGFPVFPGSWWSL